MPRKPRMHSRNLFYGSPNCVNACILRIQLVWPGLPGTVKHLVQTFNHGFLSTPRTEEVRAFAGSGYSSERRFHQSLRFIAPLPISVWLITCPLATCASPAL